MRTFLKQNKIGKYSRKFKKAVLRLYMQFATLLIYVNMRVDFIGTIDLVNMDQ